MVAPAHARPVPKLLSRPARSRRTVRRRTRRCPGLAKLHLGLCRGGRGRAGVEHGVGRRRPSAPDRDGPHRRDRASCHACRRRRIRLVRPGRRLGPRGAGRPASARAGEGRPGGRPRRQEVAPPAGGRRADDPDQDRPDVDRHRRSVRRGGAQDRPHRRSGGARAARAAPAGDAHVEPRRRQPRRGVGRGGGRPPLRRAARQLPADGRRQRLRGDQLRGRAHHVVRARP